MNITRQANPTTRYATLFLFGLVLVAAVVLRCIGLDHLPGVSADEAWCWVQMSRFASGQPVNWRTPTGNLMPPVQAAVTLFVQALVVPTFTILRAPTVLSSLIQLGVAYWAIRWLFHRSTALVATALMAALPVNIAYARFGWEPSTTGLAAIVATYFALSRQVTGMLVGFLFAVAVHPTNVFLAPFLWCCFLGSYPSRQDWRSAWRRIAVMTVAMAACACLVLFTTSRATHFMPAQTIPLRLLDPRQWFTFVIMAGRFLVGDVSLEYIVGKPMGPLPSVADMLAWSALLFAVVVVERNAPSESGGRRRGVAIGLVASAAALFVTSGSLGVSPHHERYAMCLLVPMVLCVSLYASQLLTPRRAEIPSLLVSMLLLARFYQHYIVELQTTGSLSHRTFWTGATEPKETAFSRVLDDAGDRDSLLVAEDYWLYWPMSLLALSHPQLLLTQHDGPSREQDVERATREGRRIYYVGFAGGALESLLARENPIANVPGYARATVLHVWRPTARNGP